MAKNEKAPAAKMPAAKTFSAHTTTHDIEITLEKIGPDVGTIRVKSTATGKDGRTTDDKNELYGIKVSAEGDTIFAKARVFGPDPDVTITLGVQGVSVEVNGALAGNGITRHAIPRADAEQISAFVKTLGFPKR